jgi:hypothetical protein
MSSILACIAMNDDHGLELMMTSRRKGLGGLGAFSVCFSNGHSSSLRLASTFFLGLHNTYVCLSLWLDVSVFSVRRTLGRCEIR